MTVSKHGRVIYSWPVSTARKGYVTPRGNYRPTRLHQMWYSRKYDMSPMPYSVFFRGGYAIHGTGYVKQLGRPASHGCVRLRHGQCGDVLLAGAGRSAAATRASSSSTDGSDSVSSGGRCGSDYVYTN